MENYKILTIAPSGAGKTVLLGSIFKQLSIQGKYGFFLKVEDGKQRSELTNIYAEIVTGEKWPRGTTGDVKEWVFTCCVKTHNLSMYPVCQFTYIDYPGGLITNPQDNDFDFAKAVINANAVLAILDGTQLLALMENKDVSRWLETELRPLTQIIQECGRIPVHFIISKWDVIHNKYDLSQVRKRLLNVSQEFKDVVDARKEVQPMRLIPISSIGMEFATLESDGRSMKKIPNRIPQPYQLELPITYAMTDTLEEELKEVSNKLNQGTGSDKNQILTFLKQGFPGVNKGIFIQPINWLGFYINMVSSPLISSPLKELFMIIKKGDYKVDLNQVKDQETALQHTIKCFKEIQTKFIKEFPASDLHE
ncbi:hypothetical protein PQG02_03225 [Nostoc sp. UHCC 0926]|uniref:hypothetical protein n=1 Tax=unclassified Nostoc TaxID=2593658 RepID=UPI002361DFD2|nr:hypothetical protein [Nostoc sp. UHCC 0926]WDD33419.1 hypothetical protein PQG02_03225 [Nostoc sp. UHCC 0926]